MSETSTLTVERRREETPERPVAFALGNIDFAVPTDPALDQALAPGSRLFETFRVLRTRIETKHVQPRARCLGIVGATSGEGATTIALGLTMSLARDATCSVLLVDGALRSPAVASRLGLSEGPGLAEWLADTDEAPVPLRRVEPAGLFVLPAGQPTSEGASLFESTRFTRLLDSARTTFDLVVVDCTSLLPYADTVLMQDRVDAFLLTVRARWASRALIREAVSRLKADRIEGLLLNDTHEVVRRRLSPGPKRRG